MSVADGAGKVVVARKQGTFLLVFLPSLIVLLGVAAFGLGQMVAAKDASGYGVDEIVTGAITADAPAAP